MNEELELFFEDLEDQLTLMENALLDMQGAENIDKEMINQVFRAMHTIKGNAGMFGFDDIVSFTHKAENLLDNIRNDKIEMTPEMVDLFLEVKDHVEEISRLAGDNETMDSALQEKHNKLLTELSKYLNEEIPQNNEVNEEEDKSDAVNYHLSLELLEDFFESGMKLESIIVSLEDICDELKLYPIVDKIPLLDEINPLKAYIKCEFDLLNVTSKEDIEEVFEFIEDDVNFEIIALEEEKIEAPKEEIKEIPKEEPKPTPPKVVKVDNKPKKIEKKSYSLRVDSTKIDTLINQISELVIANAKIAQIADESNNSELEEASSIMTSMIEEIRDGIMNVRMVQVGDSFSKFRRIVNEISKKLGKEIEFKIVGGETELDKTVVEKISDPLVHMLRNSLDHGIETPEERIKKGKPPKGSVILKAYPDAGTIVIEIIDDGKGIDPDFIYKKATEKGVIKGYEELSKKEILNLIFAPGFSTAETISDISGRGVGMDVVKKNIEELRGTVEIDSEVDKGSKITIRLPLTLAIIDGFLVQAGKTKYIIPLEMINECIELTPKQKEEMKGSSFINLRGNILPILDIRKFYNEEIIPNQRENIVVVKYANKKIGLQVDELYGEFQTVIKSLGDIFDNLEGISGGTILGSGEIALIFDIPKLIEQKIKD